MASVLPVPADMDGYEAADAAMKQQVALDRLKASTKAIVAELQKEADRRVGRRSEIELRWLEDTGQYHGKYDEETKQNLSSKVGSQLYINMTRPKTDAMSARLMDLLFPTDDKNWGIQPTPVPELSTEAGRATDARKKISEQLEKSQTELEAQAATEAGLDDGQIADTLALQEAAELVDDARQELTDAMDEAKKRADLMATEIEDQLVQCNYQASMRDMIDDACKIGTGICKGPVTGDKVRKGWQQATDESGAPTGYELGMSDGDQPAMRYVDPWSFFPDPDVRTIHEGEGCYERHLMNKKALRKLAQLPGFEQDAIRRLLKAEPKGSVPSYLATLSSITGENTTITHDQYHVWEYSGALEADQMRDLALVLGDEDTAAEMDEIDPLTEVNAVVWFCDNEVLKFAIYPFYSGETMYSVFNLLKDEHSIFGYGIPRTMADPQRALNAAWRAMMDNATLSVGPQVIVAKGNVEPENGSYDMEPNKVWLAAEGIPQGTRAFDVFNIPSNQVELANIIQIASKFIDDMTQLPALANGEQGSGVTKTAQGMALLMNSANVVLRRVVKNFDDDVTTPNIRRFYDWNMQFSKNDDIKGDYAVDARGSSVLLVREMQAQNLMVLTMQLGGHPVYGPMIRNRDMLRLLFKAHMIPADEILLSQDEIDAVMAKAQQEMQMAQEAAMQAPQGEDLEAAAAERDLRERELDAKFQLANMDADTKRKVATLQHETKMMELAEKMNMDADKLEAMLTKTAIEIDGRLAKTDMELASKENMIAAEAVSIQQTGEHGGGYL